MRRLEAVWLFTANQTASYSCEHFMKKNPYTLKYLLCLALPACLGTIGLCCNADTNQSNMQQLIATPGPATPQDTLPTYLSRRAYDHYIADELGWEQHPDKQNLCHGYFWEPSSILDNPSPKSIQEEPTQITATGPTIFVANGVSVLQKNVVVTQPGRIAKGDIAYLYRDSKTRRINKIILVGHVKLQEAGKLIVADKGILTLYPKESFLMNTAYHLHGKHPYTATASLADSSFDGWGVSSSTFRDQYETLHLKKANYSTCNPLHPSWQLSADRMVLDHQHNIGKAYHTVLKVHNIPVFYFPYYSFPLKHERKTGLLVPQIGHSTDSGEDIALPFYWNLAPNYDTTITPEYYTLRGFRLSDYFRYLGYHSAGNFYMSYLPDDSAFEKFRNNSFKTFSALKDPELYQPYLNALTSMKDYRGFVSTADIIHLNERWFLKTDINYVTDPYYFQDIRNNNGFGFSTANQLLNRVDLEYVGNHWDFSGLAQAYQTLHRIGQTNPAPLDQYNLLPDLMLDGYYPNLLPHLDVDLQNELTNFDYSSAFAPNRPIGQRLNVRPGLSLPLENNFLTFVPQIWLDNVAYNTLHQQADQTSTASRTLPIIDIDNQFYVDRMIQLGSQSYIQTFEPRLFYLYIPYQNQDRLPNFDTILLPFSFEQLFSFNRYTGIDRLDNANQITLGLTSHLLNTNSGLSLLTLNIGSAYYFSPSKVCLTNNCINSDNHFSPIVGELKYALTPYWGFTSNIAWDPGLQEINNSTATLSYSRDQEHIMQMSYTFVHEDNTSITPGVLLVPNSIYSTDTSNITFGAIWPLFYHWSTLGFGNYNIQEKRIDNYYLGLQFDTCCWAVRFIVQRSYTGSLPDSSGVLVKQFDNNYYFQLVLKGLGDFGSGNIDPLLKNTIPGLR